MQGELLSVFARTDMDHDDVRAEVNSPLSRYADVHAGWCRHGRDEGAMDERLGVIAGYDELPGRRAADGTFIEGVEWRRRR
jgi:hypothetical protein